MPDDEDEPLAAVTMDKPAHAVALKPAELTKKSFVQQEEIEDNTMRIPQHIMPLRLALLSETPKPTNLGKVTRTPVTRAKAKVAPVEDDGGFGDDHQVCNCLFFRYM